MLAITLGWKHYVQQKTSSDATSSIKSVGVCQFAYLCCPAMTEEATSLLESAEFLVNSGVGITKCQEIGDGCHADALGFFVSSHLRCPLSTKSDRVYQNDHHKVFRLLLELGANPRGKCLDGWSSSGEYSGVVTIAEALISRSGLMANLELIELLARYCPNTRPLAAELFDTSPDKVFESPSLSASFDEDTFIWLCSNGAYISESLASRIYRPLIEGLKHQSNGTQTYSEALKSLSEQGMPDPALCLDRSLMNLYQYEFYGHICERVQFLRATATLTVVLIRDLSSPDTWPNSPSVVATALTPWHADRIRFWACSAASVNRCACCSNALDLAKQTACIGDLFDFRALTKLVAKWF